MIYWLTSTIHSDNGIDFNGANRELTEAYKFVRAEVQGDMFANDNIEWKSVPASSLHIGGLWKAGVKSFKYYLKRVMGNMLFTFEKFVESNWSLSKLIIDVYTSDESTSPDTGTFLGRYNRGPEESIVERFSDFQIRKSSTTQVKTALSIGVASRRKLSCPSCDSTRLMRRPDANLC